MFSRYNNFNVKGDLSHVNYIYPYTQWLASWAQWKFDNCSNDKLSYHMSHMQKLLYSLIVNIKDNARNYVLFALADTNETGKWHLKKKRNLNPTNYM